MFQCGTRPSDVCSNLSAMTTTPGITAWDLAALIRDREPVTLADLHSIIHHPRSLARPTASWRPPSKKVRLIDGTGTRDMISLTVTRHRVGTRARARVLGYTGNREPAYLVIVRVTDPAGHEMPVAAAEAWVRALVGEDDVQAVHEIGADHAPTFVWLVDASFSPVPSPASLFTESSDAA